MALEIVIEDARWADLPIDAVADQAVARALTHLGLDPAACEIALLACDDARIAVLNADFRGKAQPTNVLSWPAEDLTAETDGGAPLTPQADPGGEIALGDIAIAWETCAREAAEQGKTLKDHVTHLIVHGLLHLLGYDHLRDRDATMMEELEARILGTMGIDDPY
ncbi:MAG: rRNA maturation RNase YbeY [Rhodobacteraceae bacterium]|nr:MAG: rRNA maturation RNase YbeY [Paracoccaceae bacterium]